MSDTVICMTIFIMMMVCVWTYIDISHMIPFIQEVAESYRKPSEEVDSSLKVNNRSLFIVQVAMIVAYLVLGYQVPARLVLSAAGLGVGEKVFMVGFQVIVEALGYKKAKEAKGTAEEKPETKAEEEAKPEETTETKPEEVKEKAEEVTEAKSDEISEQESKVEEEPKTDTEKVESQSEVTKVEDKASSEGTHADEAKIEK